MKKIMTKKKVALMIALLGIIVVCTIGGYSVWGAYHPEIHILVSEGATGKEGIRMEAPHIAIAGRGRMEPVRSISKEIDNVSRQHENLSQFIKDTYQSADIHLDIDTKQGQMLLHYYGTVTSEDEVPMHFEKDLLCDFSAGYDLQ